MSFIELVAQRRSPSPPPGMQPPENAKDWFRIDNSAEDAEETDVYIYDSIGGWFGMYADEFIEALGQVTTSKINLRLNSPGGSVFEGIAIANAIRSHPATVTVYVDSLAASIASVIALAGDRVVMMPQSQFMIHNASGAAYGDASEMTKMADLLDKQSRNIAEAYAEHTGRPMTEWQDYMAAETWFTAEEAVAVGLADEVMPMRPKKGEQAEDPASVAASATRTWDLSMYRYAGRAQAPEPKTASTPFANGGLVSTGLLNGITAELQPGELAVPVATIASMSRDELIDLIREVINGQTETPSDEAAPEDAAEETADPEDAKSKKKLPAFLQPDEDEDEKEAEDASEDEPEASAQEDLNSPEGLSSGDGTPPPEHPVDTGPGDAEATVEHTETYDENDEWRSLVDRLIPALSPSADDVFNSLKEAL